MVIFMAYLVIYHALLTLYHVVLLKIPFVKNEPNKKLHFDEYRHFKKHFYCTVEKKAALRSRFFTYFYNKSVYFTQNWIGNVKGFRIVNLSN